MQLKYLSFYFLLFVILLVVTTVYCCRQMKPHGNTEVITRVSISKNLSRKIYNRSIACLYKECSLSVSYFRYILLYVYLDFFK